MSEWVEIIEPRTHEHMFANLSTGECLWDPPVGVAVKKTSADQWWELFDQNTARFYYYNASSQETVWHRPRNCDIIPLAKLQTLKQNTQVTATPEGGGGRSVDLGTQTPGSKSLEPLSPSLSSPCSLKSRLSQTVCTEVSPRHKRRSHTHHAPHRAVPQYHRRRTTIGGADAKYYQEGGTSGSPALSKQRSLEVLQPSPSKRHPSRPPKINPDYAASSISRSVSFVSRHEPTSWKAGERIARRSVESTPQSSRRKSTEYGGAPSSKVHSPHPSQTENGATTNSKSGPKIMTPLQKYILDQAKLSGYRFGDPIHGEDRDSYVESEDDHRHDDDSDDFADDEEAASEEEGVSSSRASTSSNEEDDYLSEPTYHNVGWNMTKNSDTDAFSEEFDQRMRLGGRLSSYSVQHQVSTMPRPHPPQLPPISSLPTPQYPIPYDVSSLQRNSSRNNHQYSIPSGGSSSFNNHHSSSSSPQVQPGSSTLSVSTSIHSTISCESDIEKYAQDNMNIQKRGLFRRKMTVKDILSWTSEGISKPLTCLSEKGSKKEAIELFKLIQIYMGDRKAKAGMTINSVALDVTTSGYLRSTLRDEIFVQLCKQTTENPRKESLRRGWELLAICLACFPPSSAFAHCLSNYISRHRDPALDDFPDLGKWPIHVQISHFAGICAKRLERIGEGGHLVPKKPSVEDIDQSRLQIFRPSMFGGTLEETLEMQRDRFPHKKIPWILTTLAQQIIQLNGTGTEGIFRVPADMEEVNNLKSRFDQWEVPLCVDCHTAASLLKLWFRELYEPIIPSFLYEEAVNNPDDPKFVVNLVTQRLSESNVNVLAFLIRLLQIFDRQEVIIITKMDSSNISTVFAPNVLRCPSSDPTVILENARKEMAFVKTLIDNFHTAKTEEDPVF